MLAKWPFNAFWMRTKENEQRDLLHTCTKLLQQDCIESYIRPNCGVGVGVGLRVGFRVKVGVGESDFDSDSNLTTLSCFVG